MPDFGAPVAENINSNPNQGLQTLSSLINLERGQVGLQQQKQALDIGATQLQQQNQQMQERQALQAMMLNGKDPDGNPIKDENGEIDAPAFAAAANKYLPLTGQNVTQSIIQTMDSRLKLNDSIRGLNQNFRNDISGIVRSAVNSNQSGQDINAALDAYAKKNPGAAPAIGRAQSLLQNISPGMPQNQRNQALLHLAQEFQPAATTEREQTPQMGMITGSGSGVQPIQTNPLSTVPVGKVSGEMGQGIPPGLSTFTDQAGNTWAFNPQVPGHAILVGHGGRTGTGGQPARVPSDPSGQAPSATSPAGTPATQTAPPVLNLGEADVVKQNTQNVNNTRQTAADSQTQHDILNRIQSIAGTPGLYLGPGSDKVGALATAISRLPGMEGAAQYANNYNELTKFMAQNAARMGSQMGLSGSDARLDLALHSQPNAQMDPRTVQHVAQYMAGLVKMSAAKADALDHWLQQPGNSLQNEQNFERVWRDNADPRLFQLNEMKDQGDAQDYARLHIRKSELQDIQKKHDALKAMGAIP